MKTMIEDNDPINKRILDCLDLKLKNNEEYDRISIFKWYICMVNIFKSEQSAK